MDFYISNNYCKSTIFIIIKNMNLLRIVLLLLIVTSSVFADVRIGVLLFSKQFEPAYLGLKDGLVELGYKPKFFIENINGNLKVIEGALQKFKKYDVDILFTTTTPILKEVKKHNNKFNFKIVFNEVADPKELNVLGKDITGVSHEAFELIPKRIEMALYCFPKVKHVYYINYNSPEFKSKTGYLKKLSYTNINIPITIIEYTELFKKLSYEENSIFVLAPISELAQNFKNILNIADKYNIPIIPMDNIFVYMGATLSYSPDFYDIGKQTALIVSAILNGVDINHIPYQQPQKISLYINSYRVKKYNLKLNPLCNLLAEKVVNEEK